MQFKKEILLFCSLLLLSACLLIATGLFGKDANKCTTQGIQKAKCSQQTIKTKSASPWNFITQGILHLSV